MNLLSILLFIFFTFIFFYFDLKYRKIPNLFFFVGICILILFAFFFREYWFDFIIRAFIIFFVFYFLWIQDRVAGGDFKLYFILTGFLAFFILSYGGFGINWLYYDISIIVHSLIIGFLYLFVRYLFLYLYNLFVRKKKFVIDDFIKYKFLVDRKDAYIHFNIFIRILVYGFLTYLTFLLQNDYLYIGIFIIILEFVFMGWFINFLKDLIYIPYIHIIRKKQFKYLVWTLFIFSVLFLIYYKMYFLIFFLLFGFLEYIIIIIQLNFDTKVEDISKLNGNEKVSIRSFTIDFDKLNLLEEYTLNEVKDSLKEQKNIEIITEIPYGVFIILGIIWFILTNL